jgi:hypothetical protein
MSEREPLLVDEQTLHSLVEQVHVTLQQIVEQQNDRIHRLETQLNLATQKFPKQIEAEPVAGLDSQEDVAVSQRPPSEVAQVGVDDFPMIMSIWPDPNEAIQTKVASQLSRRPRLTRRLTSRQQPLHGPPLFSPSTWSHRLYRTQLLIREDCSFIIPNGKVGFAQNIGFQQIAEYRWLLTWII